MYRASSLNQTTYLHLSSSSSQAIDDDLWLQRVPSARLKYFNLVTVNLLFPEDLYQMHHTLPSEKTYRSNAVFFTSSKGLVFRPWFEHERLYRARIAIDVVSHSRANLYSPKCLEGEFPELPLRPSRTFPFTGFSEVRNR